MADTAPSAAGTLPGAAAGDSIPALQHQQTDELPIEAASEEGDSDEFDPQEGFETRSTGSTSACSSVFAHTYEHGRRYHHFKNGRYPIPNDNDEQSREDMKHAMMLELMDGKLFYAPIGDTPQMILDIGTGTGEFFCLSVAFFGLEPADERISCEIGIWAIDGMV